MLVKESLKLLVGDSIHHIDDQRSFEVHITMKSGLELQIHEEKGCGLVCTKGHHLEMSDEDVASSPYLYCPECKIGWDSVEDFLQNRKQKWSKQWVLNT